MTYALALAGLAFANMLGIISPGPAFLMVSRAAAGRDLKTAVGLAAGVAVAATLWAAAACFGIALLIAEFRPLYTAIEIAGAVYLIWLGVNAWRHSGTSGGGEAAAAPRLSARGGLSRAVVTGAMLSLGNPKMVIFFSSIFVALLPVDAPLWLRFVVIGIVAVQEITWYTAVAFVFSRPRVQAAYRRASKWIERALGMVLVGLGARILVGVRV